MRLLSQLFPPPGQVYGRRLQLPYRTAWAAEKPARMYEILAAYYDNNGLYYDVQNALYFMGVWQEGMLPLRNPANRVVEFYASKLWPGADLTKALPIQTDHSAIVAPIQQIWKWSNWAARKQVAVRWMATFGDLFIKTAQDDSRRPYLQLLHPCYVTDLDEDTRGYPTYVRIDVPQNYRSGDTIVKQTYTEVWSKAQGTLRTWLHNKGADDELDKLGDPQTTLTFEDLGIDFIPIVHGKHRDTGETRGVSAFAHALDKIDECNRQATRLHQMLFRNNKALWALEANGNDASGRPLPPPAINQQAPRIPITPSTLADGLTYAGGADPSLDPNVLRVGDDALVRLPGTSKLSPLVPQLDYKSALDILNAQIAEVKEDCPELAYYDLREIGTDLSGRAVRLLLGDAIDRALEARGNAEQALQAADAMALTLGIAAGFFPASLGTYDAGDFDHSFEPREIIPVSDQEKAETDQAEATAATSWKGVGVSVDTLLERAGFDPEVEREQRTQDAEEAMQQMMAAMDRGPVGGGGAPPAAQE